MKKIRFLIMIILFILLGINILTLFYLYFPKFKDTMSIYLGDEITKEDFLKMGFKNKNIELLTDINNFNNAGSFDIRFKYKDENISVNLIVKDNIAPKVVFKNAELVKGTELDKKVFVQNVDEHSKYEIIIDDKAVDYNNYGTYNVLVTVKDEFNNKTSQNCTLEIIKYYPNYSINQGEEFVLSNILVDSGNNENIKVIKNNVNTNIVGEYRVTFEIDGEVVSTIVNVKDVTGPEITGVKTITSYRGNVINYLNGVTSIDANDGKLTITIQDSKVDINKVGEYEVVYSSCDKSNNITETVAKVIIIPSEEEINELFIGFYNKYLKGKDVLGMAQAIRSQIKYKNVRGFDPLYTAMSTMSGSCYVHAALLKKALDYAGIDNYLVENTGKYHFWVLAYENGKWRHYDPTPGIHSIGPDTDASKSYAEGIGNLYWDSSYPKAN